MIDIIKSDNPKQVERATMIIGTYGHATTEYIMLGYLGITESQSDDV